MLMETYRDISIYDANNYFLLIGRTKSAEFYKLLKIKKLSNSLEIQEVKRSLKKSDLNIYLKDLLQGENRNPVVHAEVLLGVIKFLQGFYLFIVTKKLKVAILRGKAIYKVIS